MSDQSNPSIVVREFGDLISAIVARGILESEGIWCFLEGEGIAAQGHIQLLTGGALKLIVRAEDASAADSLLQSVNNRPRGRR
jgi:Putative prokaryotic signal transducing protein